MMNIAPFSKSGLQVLAGEYLAGCVLKWDEESLFDQLFAAGCEPEMFALTWELSELLCKMVIVVGPGSPEAFILRVILAPEFVWFGLHWAGLPYPVPLSTYSSHLSDLLQSRPLVASMALHQNMGVGDQWKSLVRRLWVHFEPYGLRSSANSGNDILPTVEDVDHIFPPEENVRPMEGVEFVSGVDGDTMIREDSPDMVVCDVPEAQEALPPPPMTSPLSLPGSFCWRRPAPSLSPEYEAPRKEKYRQRY